MLTDLVVVGLGRVGTPLALMAASRGLRVVGLDLDPERVEILNRGTDPFGDERDLERVLRDAVDAGRFRATTAPEKAIPGATAIIVAVPLWLDGARNPNFAFLDRAVSTISRFVSPGAIVSFETTQPVGTTSGRHTQRIEDLSGLVIGEELFVAFSPERIKVGHVFRDLRRYPKIVGGVDKISTKKVVALYRRFLPKVWSVKNADTAEFVKLAETAYRDLNIALAHELGDAADRSGIDFSEVRRAANSQPESDLHVPGIGVGGHCIPVYPHLFMHSTPGLALVAHGRELNERRPILYTRILESELGSLNGRRVAVLGAAYRPNLGLVPHSSVFALVEQLENRDARVSVFDPHATSSQLRSYGLVPGSIGSSFDAAIIHTAHDEFRKPEWHSLAPILIDGRGLLSDTPPRVVRYIAPGFRSG